MAGCRTAEALHAVASDSVRDYVDRFMPDAADQIDQRSDGCRVVRGEATVRVCDLRPERLLQKQITKSRKTMNTFDWIREIIGTKRVAAIPIMTHPGIEILGYRVLDAETDGEVHFKAIQALDERFPQSSASTVIMDLSVEAEAFGAKLHFAENEVPSVVGRLVSSYDEVMALPVPSVDSARVPVQPFFLPTYGH